MVESSVSFAISVGFGATTLVICAYYLMRGRHIDALSRKFILAGFFFAVHQLSVSLADEIIYELTKVAFFIVFFYAIAGIVSTHAETIKKLEEAEQMHAILKERLAKLNVEERK